MQKKGYSGICTVPSSGQGLPDFFLVQLTKMAKDVPNDHKIYKIEVKYIKSPFSIQRPSTN
jgi:hypothetical protein